VCLEKPDPFLAIGEAYLDFSPTTDDEVIELLGRSSGG
jgi:predicted phosphoribosyltransferase